MLHTLNFMLHTLNNSVGASSRKTHYQIRDRSDITFYAPYVFSDPGNSLDLTADA